VSFERGVHSSGTEHLRTPRRGSAAHPDDCGDRSDYLKAAFLNDDGICITHDGTSSVFAPPVADEHAITDHRDHKFCGRRTSIAPPFDDKEVAALDTEFLQVRSRGAKDNLFVFDDVCGNRERLAANTSINRQALRNLSGELKTAVALAMPNATLRHRCASTSEFG
jgi:hypothetical protein